MARTHLLAVRLTDREWDILDAWVTSQSTDDPDTPRRHVDAIRQAIRDLEAMEQKRARDRQRRREQA